MGEISDERIALMTDMSLAADRPLNWNLLGSASPTPVFEQQLTSSDHAAAHGAKVVALALPDVMRLRSSRMLQVMPGWGEVVALPDADRRAPSPTPRCATGCARVSTRHAHQGLAGMMQWDLVELPDGRSVAEVAAERGTDPVDVLLDVVVPDGLPLTTIFPSLVPPMGVTDESWEVRGEVWRDERVVLGGSDAGAHVDIMCHANYPSVVLGELVRRTRPVHARGGVREMTGVPAALFGLRDRGRSPRARTPTSCCSTPTPSPATRRGAPRPPRRRVAPLRRGRRRRAGDRGRRDHRRAGCAHRRQARYVAPIRCRHRHRDRSGVESMANT